MNTTTMAWAGLLVAGLTLGALTGCEQSDDGGGGASSGEPAAKGKVDRMDWGEVDGKKVELVTLTNDNGLIAKATNWGTILVELHVPDKDGKLEDIVLGFDKLDPYVVKENRHPYFGATAGRVANRIAGGKFSIDGQDFTLATNNGPNHLHGGEDGFDRKVWDIVETGVSPSGPYVQFEYVSPDGEEGYPGQVTATVTYTLTNDNEFKVEMGVASDKATPVNLAHHTYWNLGGHASGSVLDHELQINAEKYTPADDTLIPTGEFAKVAGTPFDFREPKKLGKDIQVFKEGFDKENRHPSGGGYDINFVLTDSPSEMRQVSTLYDPSSGRVMMIYANQPGVQLYTGNWLDGVQGKGGAVYDQHHGVCLETQMHPDAIHHVDDPAWPNPVLKPGKAYNHIMVHRFTTQ